jgi:ABC-type phosphate transport system substrate-binding protein
MRQLLITICLWLIIASPVGAEELVIIVNSDNQTSELTHRQLVNLYMGRTQQFPDGTYALPLDQAPDSEARQIFYKELVGKSVAEVNAYWARLLFTGRASPPRTVADAETVLLVVRENRNAIGYIERKFVDETVKVVGKIH